MSNETVHITTVERALTDGSTVFDVHIGNLILAAYDETGADQLVEAMRDAIEANTVDMAVAVVKHKLEAGR